MQKDTKLCWECQDSPVEYRTSVTGLVIEHGLCRCCYERSVRFAVRDKSQEMVTKRRKTQGSGYTGGTGFKSIR